MDGFLFSFGRRFIFKQTVALITLNYADTVALRAQPGHQFCPDAVSLCDSIRFRTLPGTQDLTDFYLLALAVEHEARFATLDRRFDPATLPGGPAACFLIT